MKRKPLKFLEQWRQVQFHTHQRPLEHMCAGPHYVTLPEADAGEEGAQPASGGGTVTVKQETGKGGEAGGGGGGDESSGSQPKPNQLLGAKSVASTSSAMASGLSGVTPTTSMLRPESARDVMEHLEKQIKEENQARMSNMGVPGVSPLPPQFQQGTGVPQQMPQQQVGQMRMAQPVMSQQSLVRSQMMAGPHGGGGFSGQPQQQPPQQQRLETLTNYLNPMQRKQFPNLTLEQKRMVLNEARHRFMVHMRMQQQQQQQQQQQPPQQQRLLSRPAMAVQYRQSIPQSGPLHANPPMPMQQIIQQRQVFPAPMQQHHPAVAPGQQHYMMRPSMYQPNPGGMYPGPPGIPRPQHHMPF